ncbi:methyltransferase-domain-containing protein [Elsinoe ampelina]|uniref:Ribosomal RNA-processing protein 8 n=1 Tax=Elsinoe ampelina TaxID=302913 RepID=A0A6A6GDX7_9PEZI|nr:methyltransferase-domain-containing protein [Elsinoe ampelina]
MFAVPGWSLQASAPKRQTEAHARKADPSGVDAEGKTSRKRKRKSGNQNGDASENSSKRSGEQTQNKTRDKPSKKAKKSKDHKSKDKHPNANNEPLGNSKSAANATPKTKPATVATTLQSSAPPPALTPLQQKMRAKLISARFRHLNETLYTTPSSSSVALFADSPSVFADYHAGFRQQVSVWPQNPVEVFIATIEARAKINPAKLRRQAKFGKGSGELSEVNGGKEEVEALPRTREKCTIADLGCGDAEMARRVMGGRVGKKLGVTVRSFDLAAPNEWVTKADVANLPLRDGEVDVAVFCLALMGTNWVEFVEEAWRVLRWKGELWVAEIKSRFGRGGKNKVVEHSVGKRRKGQGQGKKEGRKEVEEREKGEEEELRMEVDGEERKEETDVSAFVEVLARRGFVLRKGEQSIDLSNKMFVRMEFVKAAAPTVGRNVKQDQKAADRGGKKRFVESDDIDVEAEAKVLKPCLYKIR